MSSAASSDSVSAVLRVRESPADAQDDDTGGQSWYDDGEQSGLMMVDSPVSAADMLSRSLQQGYLRRRREADRRRAALGNERGDASTSSAPQQVRRAKRKSMSPPASKPAAHPRQSLFPESSGAPSGDRPADYISPPTARNNPDAARRRRSTARSSFAAPDYAEDDDTTQRSGIQRQAPMASTPFHASTAVSRRTARGNEDVTPTHSRADSIANLFASSAARRSQTRQQGRRSVLSSSRPYDASIASSSSASSKAPRAANAFARWGGGVEESPMDLLRRLAAAPGFAATATPSDQVRGDSESGVSSILRPGGTRAADRRRYTLATSRDRAAEQSAYSDAGQGRRQGYGVSSPLHRGDAEVDELDDIRSILSMTDEGRSRLGGRPSTVRFADATQLDFLVEEAEEDELEEQELEEVLQASGSASREGFVLGHDDEEGSEATGGDGFAFEVEPQPGGSNRRRTNKAAGIFDGLLDDDDDESLPDSIQSAQQVSANAEEHDYYRGGDGDDGEIDDDDEDDDDADVVGRDNLPAFEDDEQMYDDEFDDENDVTVRVQRAFDDTAPTRPSYSDDDDDDDDDIAHQKFGDSDIDDEVRKREDAARMKLLMTRKRKRQAKRTSALTGKAVMSMPPMLTHTLFKAMVMPSLGIGSITAPGKKRARPRITVDRLALEAVETASHHFLTQFAARLSERSGRKKGKRRIASRGTIDESDILALLHEDGTLNERTSLLSLARKYLPREMSDVLPADMELMASASYEVAVRRKPRKNRAKRQQPRRFLDEQLAIEESEGATDSDSSTSSAGSTRRRGGIVSLAEEPVTKADQEAEARRLRAQARKYGVEKQTRNVWQRGEVTTTTHVDDEAETGESEESGADDRDADLEARTGESIEPESGSDGSEYSL